MIQIENEKRKIIHDYLTNKEETVAVAESVTSGLLQWALASIEDASQFYQGGITAYNIGQKYKHLHVEPIQAEACDCVSDKVSQQMALQVCEMFQSQWGIAITGYAVPTAESRNKLFAFYAIAYRNKIVKSVLLHPPVTDPDEVQKFYAKQIIDAFVDCIVGGTDK